MGSQKDRNHYYRQWWIIPKLVILNSCCYSCYRMTHHLLRSNKTQEDKNYKASLVAQRSGILLPMQGMQVRALVWENPTCRGAARPMCCSCWACALEPVSHGCWARMPQLLSPRATAAEVHVPGAHAPQQERPPQWEAHAPQRGVAPAHRGWRGPAISSEDPTQPKINKFIKNFLKTMIMQVVVWCERNHHIHTLILHLLWPSNPTSMNLSLHMCSHRHKHICIRLFNGALLLITKDWKPPMSIK